MFSFSSMIASSANFSASLEKLNQIIPLYCQLNKKILIQWAQNLLHLILTPQCSEGLRYTFFSLVTHFILAYSISLVNVQTNYCNNNLLILDVKQAKSWTLLNYCNNNLLILDVKQAKSRNFITFVFKSTVGWTG